MITRSTLRVLIASGLAGLSCYGLPESKCRTELEPRSTLVAAAWNAPAKPRWLLNSNGDEVV